MLRIDDPEGWVAEPSWLGNPADRFEVRREEEGVLFRVREAGRGMKWRRPLDPPVSLAPHRYVSIRYRAEGVSRGGDYILAILGGPEGGPDAYRTPILPQEIRSDGRWRRASAGLGDAAGRWTIRGIAIQVQAEAEPTEIEVSEVRFTRDPPLVPLKEILPFRIQDAAAPEPQGFETIDLAAIVQTDASSLRDAFRTSDWFPEGRILCHGVPFRILGGPRNAAATGLDDNGGEGAISVPLSGRTSEIALILAARFEGQEEPSLGAGELRELRGVDRALFRIEYEEGPPDEMLCLSVPENRCAIVRGPQVAVLFPDPARELRALEIAERSPQVDLILLAATALRSPRGPFENQRPGPRGRAVPRQVPAIPVAEPKVTLEGTKILCEAGAIRARIDLKGLRIEELHSGWTGGELGLSKGSRLLRVFAGKGEISPEAWEVVDAGPAEPARIRFALALRAERVDLHLSGDVSAAGDEILWRSTIENRGVPVDIRVIAPELEGLRVEDPAKDILFYPKRGAVLTARPCSFSRPGSGLFPVQFIDLSSPKGGGIYLRTEDTTGLDRLYEASKGAGGTHLAVAYPSRRLEPGAVRAIARSSIGVHGGDWHAAFDAYMRWLGTWHRPRLPLKVCFREIFNFRQRFLWFWDPIYDAKTGRFRMEDALDEAREAFGGIEYLHMMDWGSHPEYGRVYGRTGDHAPWDAWKGGKESFASAIERARRAGVPVGLYVEGYLLQERGKLGSGPGKDWQILGPGGERRYWPSSTEMFICPWVEKWREIQVDTYRRLVSMFHIQGVYIDQFGFADWGKMCWSQGHGHGIPATPLLGEVGLTKAVSETLRGIDPNLSIYTEETPCDLAGGFQDGSFTYAMNDALRTPTDVPLNIARFAFPWFKTFEILICDQPTGSWATGVLWTFFNGEGIWLEGPGNEWFRPHTLDAIRRTHAILRKYRDAFTSLRPEPLVPTLAGGIYANRFPGADNIVYTLWNSWPCTYRGPALAIPIGEGKRFHDAWNDRKLAPKPRGDGTVEVSVEIGPYGVGCVVVDR